MATALIRGMVRAGVAQADRILVSDPLEGARASLAADPGVVTLASNAKVAERSEILVLAVKPQSMTSVLAEIQPLVGPDHLVISVAAGVTLETLGSWLGPDCRLIRVMPNTPALVGAGGAGYAIGANARAADEELVRKCLDSVGRSFRVTEPLLDAVTGLCGSGPAFVYVMIEALSDGGVRMGLPRDVATGLAAQTVLGAARMVLETGLHPGALKDQVTSPGGTTIAGLHALERAGVRGAFMDAVEAATRRATELADPEATR
jgi:pyrroline-5-carboxylate reductase